MISVIIQARMRSSRLPGKIMLEGCGKPFLGHMIERISYSKMIPSASFSYNHLLFSNEPT